MNNADKISPNIVVNSTSTSPAKSPQASNNIPPVSNKKVVTIASPTTPKQPTTQVAFVNPSESGNSRTSFSKFKVRTCCGVVELTAMKLACLLGMLVTVMGLLVLAGVAIAAFITVSSKSTEILISVGQVTSIFESSNSIIVKYIFTGISYDETQFSLVSAQYRNASQSVKSILKNIQLTLNDPKIQIMLNATTIEASNMLDSQNTQINLFILRGQKGDAIERLNSQVYNGYLERFRGGLEDLVSYVQEKEGDKDENVLAITLVQLIVICFSLVVILPIIVFVFTFAINRDSLYLEKIRRANAIMLMDTMEDETLRAIFKTHCEKEKSMENFLLLEKIQYYRSLCERSIELQMRMFGHDSNISDVSSDTSAESASSVKKKKESPLEREYNETEAKKYEVAFEIFTEFLEVTGEMAVNVSHVLTDSVKDYLDKFNDKQIETLPDTMFNILEKETCLVMMDTHHRFKQSLAFQREMKIDKIKVDKLKKKKNEF
ncbi:RGS-domain-containing protein [Naegleria gruberi]|uniref:RGS-domain-containing protein n=1 Tax=Naegleria gruberi TaxID=5762 RepID=D2VD90_NAEGR|nr:RGS-domain-containing protein [Naegleria gruberi]EFC45191.1 RGS-domain-containing protein [Naegleria gruberi]|eukprot:XP_002677935.1 RGS-domain-containing protein [Naegleria gruberi strain NEG-M]